MQLSLRMNCWGGRRSGAGRPKSKIVKTKVPHRSRPVHKAYQPVHITWRLCDGLPSLRSPRARSLVMRTLSRAKQHRGLRITHFSIQENHIHLINEAESAALGQALRALGIRLAKRLNRLWARKGKVFSERYHCETLTSPKQVRNALAYVLCNFRKHRVNVGDVRPDLVDECSSAPWFDGWAAPEPRYSAIGPPPVASPRTWLLRVGWKRWGLVRTHETPGSR